MKIIIQTNNEKIMNFSIDIQPDITIRNLKTKIWLITNIPFNYQELWYPLGMTRRLQTSEP
jgi:hypothetical protein